MTHFNTPQIRDNDGDSRIKRYVHTPITTEHHGINASIKENGKVVLQQIVNTKAGVNKDEIEYEQVEIPASLVFKLALLLKSTRTIKFVTVSEIEEPKA